MILILNFLNAYDITKLKKECASGKGDSCFILGSMYENGYGVKQNFTIAKKYFGKACDLKFQLGCKNYAILNRRGY